MPLARELARRVAALDPAAFPPEAVRWAKDAVADTMGCALLGADAEVTSAVLAVEEPASGPCLVLGRRLRVSRLQAALINGTSGHALDYDDTSKSMAGHPSVIIVPGILALAEAMDLSGAKLLEGYIVGLETATRIARGLNFHHYEKGWHPTATIGIFGAAAAAARLLGLPEEKIAHALAISASMASGIKANFGTPVKPLHAGLAAWGGLHAALLAERGIEASPVAFEHGQGFLEVYNGAGNHDAARMLEGWGAPLDILDPGMSIKKYPCVYSVHAALDAAIALHAEDLDGAGAIRKVRVRMHRRRLLPHVLQPATSPLNAKFSLAYAMARALADGAVRLDHFEEQALADATVLRLMELVETEAHDDDANDYGAEVTVTLADGRELRREIVLPLGMGPKAPLPPGMLRAKFTDCAARAIGEAASGQAFDMLMDLEHLASVRELTSVIEAASAG
jgi:2-methylcitrate dehydratase PrpD